jgi:hypothetical protein
VEPDPDGSENFSRIRTAPDPEKFISEPGSSGSGQLRIRNESEVKLLRKIDKNLTISQQLISRHNMQHLQDGNTKVKFKLRILEKIYFGSETN